MSGLKSFFVSLRRGTKSLENGLLRKYYEDPPTGSSSVKNPKHYKTYLTRASLTEKSERNKIHGTTEDLKKYTVSKDDVNNCM